MRLLIRLAILAALLIATSIQARDYKLVDIEQLDVTYLQLDKYNRDPYVPEYTGRWGNQSRLDWTVNVYHYLFWKNNVHTESLDQASVRTVGWEWMAGLRLHPNFDLVSYHHSRHVMDATASTDGNFKDSGGQFPIENGYGFTIHFITESK